MSKTKNLNSYLKNVHDLIIGEKTLEELKSKIARTAGVRIKISGRSLKTGKRKTVNVVGFQIKKEKNIIYLELSKSLWYITAIRDGVTPVL